MTAVMTPTAQARPTMQRQVALPDPRRWPVARAMRDAPSVPLTEPVASVRHRMATAGTDYVIVVDALGRGLKILSSRDVVGCWERNPSRFGATTAIEASAVQRPFVDATATVAEAMRVMRLCRSSAIGVLNESCEPIGITTAHDLVRMIDQELAA